MKIFIHQKLVAKKLNYLNYNSNCVLKSYKLDVLTMDLDIQY